MLFDCDWKSVLEHGGTGSGIVAVIWGIWNWWTAHKKDKQKSVYQK